MQTLIISLILTLAPKFGLDSKLALAVARTESSLRASAVGPVGEIGVMQIRPKYSLFKRGELFNPAINIVEGLRMLEFAKKNCKHQKDNTWVVCYNLGVTGGSRITKPKKFRYYKAVMRHYGRIK